jgi:hypothetical protein
MLMVLPIGLWVMAQSVGVNAAGWLFGSSWGQICIVVGVVLTLASRFVIKTFANQFVKDRVYLQKPFANKRAFPIVNENLAAIISGTGMASFFAGIFGQVLGVLVFIVTREVWPSLRSGSNHWRDLQIQTERPWVAVVIAANLESGSDWLTAVQSAMNSVSGNIRDELEKIVARLQWGVAPSVAFASAHELLSPLSQTIQRSSETGSPMHSALLNQAEVWIEKFDSSRVQKIETVAERLIVPVTLLQLPAFFVLGVAPMVAAEIFPMLETFSSTGIGFS